MKKSSLWFSSYYGVYSGSEPVFYTANEIDLAAAVEKNYEALRKELEVLWQNQSANLMDEYGNYSAFDDKQFPPQSWKKIVLLVWGIRNKKIQERFPITTSLIEKFPAVTSCFITKATAHSIIKPHCGETNAHYRIHLGLHVPETETEQCGMEVNGKKISWKNGKAFAFLDAYNHHVWNHTDTDRYVLIVDVLRPEFLQKRNFICARTVVNQGYFFLVYKTGFKFLYKTPAAFINALGFIFQYPVWAAIKINNRYGILKL